MIEKVLHLELVLTMRCNMACEYCYQKDGEQAPDMSREMLDKVFDRIKNENYYNKFVITFFGGEPSLMEEEIFYFLNKIKTIKNLGNKKFHFTMATNAKKADVMVKIKKFTDWEGWALNFNLSNKKGIDILSIPEEIRKISSFSFVFNRENSHEIKKELIQELKKSGLSRIILKPDVYSDLSKIKESEIKRILSVMRGEKIYLNVNLIRENATACIRDAAERIGILGDGRYIMCTRVTAGCSNGFIGNINTTTFEEAVNKRFKMVKEVTETGLCICKTETAVKSAGYVEDIINATDGAYNGYIVARD